MPKKSAREIFIEVSKRLPPSSTGSRYVDIWNDLDSRTQHEVFYKTLTTPFEDSHLNMALKRAFELAQLDPANPLSWEPLLVCLLESVFPRPKTRGAKTRWTLEARLQLGLDAARAEADLRRQSPKQRVTKQRVNKLLTKQAPYNGRRLKAESIGRERAKGDRALLVGYILAKAHVLIDNAARQRGEQLGLSDAQIDLFAKLLADAVVQKMATGADLLSEPDK
jgi:hypothetical protein